MLWKSLIGAAKRVWARTRESSASPREFAAGIALGLFIALLPLMGLQLPLALGSAALLRRVGFHVSGLAAAGGVWLTNPLTAAPIYALTYLVGLPVARALLPGTLETLLALSFGGVLLGLPVAVIGYGVALRAATRCRRAAAAATGYRSTCQQPRLDQSR